MAASRKLFFLKQADKLLSQGKIGPAIEELKKILEFDKDINIILKLGKIYLQRGRYDQTYNLFLPIINENIEDKKFDEAANLLRFIIAYNKSYLPALTKLAEIFKLSGKTNNLIALYESLVPLYKEKGMKKQLKRTLEELIQLSDTPFDYEEQLTKLAGHQDKEVEGEDSSKSMSSVLSELDFYIDDGYFGDAEKLVEQLKQEYPGNKKLLAKIEKLKKTKIEDEQQGDSASLRSIDFEIERAEAEDMELGPELEQELGAEQEPMKLEPESESISEDLFEIEFSIAEESSSVQEFEDSGEDVTGDHSSPDEGLDLDSIIVGMDEEEAPDVDTPYKEMSSLDLVFDSEEDLLQDEAPFLDDDEYLEIEKNVDNELKSIKKFNKLKPSLNLPVDPHSKDKHQVMCTVFSPPLVKIGSEILVQVFAHLYENSQEAQQMAEEFDEDAKRRGAKSLETAIQKGTELMFELKMKDIVITEPTRTMIWNGYTESVSFDVKIPENFTKNNLIGKVVISQNTVPIGMINFRIKIQKIEDKIPIRPIPLPIGEAKIYKYAFISYASEDREEVLRRVQMLSLLKIDYFQDIFNLDAGDRWEKKLYQKINEADVFFLFWSNAARNSQWVIKEISYAIQRKQGIDENPPEIIPVIIEGPPVPEPPSELKHIHFNDKMIYFINRL